MRRVKHPGTSSSKKNVVVAKEEDPDEKRNAELVAQVRQWFQIETDLRFGSLSGDVSNSFIFPFNASKAR